MDNFFIKTAYAAPIPAPVKTFIGKISTEILNPIIAILFAIATIYFIFGIARYIWNPDDEKARTDGRQAMLWGIVGMFVMVSVFGIMKFLCNVIGCNPAILNYV